MVSLSVQQTQIKLNNVDLICPLRATLKTQQFSIHALTPPLNNNNPLYISGKVSQWQKANL